MPSNAHFFPDRIGCVQPSRSSRCFSLFLRSLPRRQAARPSTALQTIFTGTIAKVANLIAIVIGGYQFAHGEPGAKKTLADVAAGAGIAVLATNVLTWLCGV